MSKSAFDKYQEQAHKTAIYPEFRQEYPFLGLAEEAGETLGSLKKYLRGDYKREEYLTRLIKELGDTLWYIAEICTSQGIRLSHVAEVNLVKLEKRKESGTIKGDGDER